MHVESEGGQDVDINLAPIIDCLVVIVTFLLASSSFLAIGVLDAGIAAGVPAPNAAPPSVLVTVELKVDQALVVKVEGKESRKIEIPSQGGAWDGERLTKELAGLKSRWSDLGGVTLAADESVAYEDVVRNMDTIRQTVPAVLLGGF
jgi:biopolymer transport protein ExbD